jgi:hypothetical protein
MEPIETKTNFAVLGQYVTDIHPNKGAPENVTHGKVFIYNDTPGKGKLFAVAGHPESTRNTLDDSSYGSLDCKCRTCFVSCKVG